MTTAVPVDLQTMADNTLRRYGEGAASIGDAQIALMFIDFANEILDEMMLHPYWNKGVVEPFLHMEDRRPEISSVVMEAGLLWKYAVRQKSRNADQYAAHFFRLMNNRFYLEAFGPNPTLTMLVVDRPE